MHIPKDAAAMILHTRAATHGTPRDNANNHPVVSPSGNISLVHNGIIWNHDSVRTVLGDPGKKLPDVDSSVLPAAIEILGLEGMEQMSGDAAVAWFEKDTGAVLHLARFSGSPLHAATLLDGSTVFASTPAILYGALNRMGLEWVGNYPNTFYEFKEGEYVQLFEGDIIGGSTVEWGDDDYYSSYSAYGRTLTSGQGRGWSDEDFEDWGRPAALTTPASEVASGSGELPNLFWVEAHDGDRQEFVSLHTLQSMLSWYNGMTSGTYELVDPDDEEMRDLRWINHFQDLGEIEIESGEYVSWVSKPNEMQDYGSLINSSVRDGIDLLRRVTM